MSNKEILRVEILEKLSRREMKQKAGSRLLGLSVRQVKRLLKRYRVEGARGLIHKSRGKISNNKIDQKTLDKAVIIIKSNYSDFGPTLAQEKLLEDHNLKFSVERLRQEMIRSGLWKPKGRKRAHVHQLRERRACFGSLIQLDGSPHDWFEGKAPKCNLNVMVDDATSICQFKFSKTETTQDYFKLVEEYILEHGLPLAFYVDKHSIFRVNNPTNSDLKKPTGKDKYEGLTQFGRACEELGVELIFANSAQAKGRVEKLNRTLQDRLVKEMRLKNISSIEGANKFLPKFISKFVSKFSVKPRSSVNMHRKLPKGLDLSKILCVKETRVLSKNLTFQYNATIFQIQTKRSAYTLRKTRVTICERHDGATKVYDHRSNLLNYTTIKKLTNTKETTAKQLNQLVDDILIRQNKTKKNPWETTRELMEETHFHKPVGAV